ncbi:hypothetical protein DN462_25855 [Citrobacter freundii]|uniref:Uncharacterized protein n=1 Tax=Citrobacter freundii TaxID=546 RepID=A0AAN4EW67_CITFR|nr:hypothetical protein [Citrobacter freundii]EKW2110634.1 hypothetical protein [Citrobacter freundii]RWS82675.1 hypothetical protein DN462_25855 [Citrobacter freundii]
MNKLTTHHHTRGILFYDKKRERRYAVNKKGFTVNTIDIEGTPEYFLNLSEGEHFQQSLVRDDLEELIYMSNIIINGVNIMEIKVINNNSNNFRALINGSLELSIHHEDGVRAMPGLPNVELLNQYWKDGVFPNAGDNEAKVREILTSIPKVNAKKESPIMGLLKVDVSCYINQVEF